MLTLFITPTCIHCQKEIGKGEEATVHVPYPKKRGFVEIQAFLKLEGQFSCKDCGTQKKPFNEEEGV